jgi:hypothetical protein
MNENKGFLDVLSGDKSVKLEITIDYTSAAILAAALYAVGLLLIIIGKRL